MASLEFLLSNKQPGEYPVHFNGKVKVASMLMSRGFIVALEHPILEVTEYSKSGNKRFIQPDILTQRHRVFLVEIDGKSHWGKIASAKDKWRDALILEKFGWKTYRLNAFWVKDMTWEDLFKEFELDKDGIEY